MELILNRHRSIIEVLSELFRKKGDNILYEEGPIATGESLKTALEIIEEETGEIAEGTQLTIIDKYFTNVKCSDAQETVATFYKWVEKVHIGQINIYSDIRGNCFESCLIDYFSGSIPLRLNSAPGKIHDRYWIFNKDGNVCVLSVGASLNGLGKQLCIAQKISPENISKLLPILGELKIAF